MKISGSGRYCEHCRKTVHNFTHSSINNVPTTAKEELCGMFLAAQIVPTLAAVELPLSLKTTLFAVSTVLGLELNQAQGQTPTQKPAIKLMVPTGHRIDIFFDRKIRF
jgi:hypothetical protein